MVGLCYRNSWAVLHFPSLIFFSPSFWGKEDPFGAAGMPRTSLYPFPSNLPSWESTTGSLMEPTERLQLKKIRRIWMKSTLNKQTGTKPNTQRSSFRIPGCSGCDCSHPSDPRLSPEGISTPGRAPGARAAPARLGRSQRDPRGSAPSPALPGTGSRISSPRPSAAKVTP